MSNHNCEKCPLRSRYDRNPKSLLGRFWKWHTNFCPSWKKYVLSLEENKRNEMIQHYKLKDRY